MVSRKGSLRALPSRVCTFAFLLMSPDLAAALALSCHGAQWHSPPKSKNHQALNCNVSSGHNAHLKYSFFPPTFGFKSVVQ